MTRLRIEQAVPLPEPFDLRSLEFLLHNVLEDHCANGSVSVILTDDAALRRLNGEFKGAFVPTDVLSFNLADPVHVGGNDLGEIYISVDRAQAQAREASRGLSDEVTWLAIHGALHLLGYSHDTPGLAATMRCREREYLARYKADVQLKGA